MKEDMILPNIKQKVRRCLVTGASGHVGVNLVKLLKSKGDFIRILIRDDAILTYLKEEVDEVTYGDITRYEDVLKATKDIDVCFHAAAYITINNQDKDKVYKTNVFGTEMIIKGCQENQVEKLVYVSSAHAIDYQTKTECIQEKPYFSPKKVKGAYAKSKAIASNYVLKANSETLKTYVCLPTAIVGPHAYKASHFNLFLRRYYKKKIKFYLKGYYNFVDVNDVCEALYQVSILGKEGESYILSGKMISVKEIIEWTDIWDNQKSRHIKVPVVLLKLLSPFFAGYYKLFKKKALFTYHAIETLNSNGNFSHQKASQFLGYVVHDPKAALKSHYESVHSKKN